MADEVRELLSGIPPAPVVTRWNSLYDCLVRILQLDVRKLRHAFAAANVPALSDSSSNEPEWEVIQEYVNVCKAYRQVFLPKSDYVV